MSVQDHLDLFLTPFAADPEQAFAHAAEVGIKNKGAVEVAAWCFELAARVEDLSSRRGVQLALMGGTACQLRFQASVQRGSRDDDFLTTASREEVARLMEDLREHFLPVSEDGVYFNPEPYTPARPTKIIDMQRYDLRAPSFLDHQSKSGSLGQHISLEFHFVSALPPIESAEGRLFPFSEDLALTVPKIAYQAALKILTLAAPSVGIPPDRERDVPKHLNDLDLLLVQFSDSDWEALEGAVDQTAAKEPDIAGHDVWSEADERLASWSHLGGTDDAAVKRAQHIQDQKALMADKLSVTAWTARSQRLRWALRCARTSNGTHLWTQARDMAATLAGLSGDNSRAARNAIVKRWRALRDGAKLPDAAGFKADVVWWHYIAEYRDLAVLPDDWNILPDEVLIPQ
jgi:hypothetical protein